MTNFPTPPPPRIGEAQVYAVTFYAAARTAAEAQQVDVGYGDARTAIDMQLSLVHVGPVSGRVETPTGISPTKLLLRLLPVGGERLGFGAEAATTLLEPDGTFTFLNVPEGEYTLLAQASVMDFTSGNALTPFRTHRDSRPVASASGPSRRHRTRVPGTLRCNVNRLGPDACFGRHRRPQRPRVDSSPDGENHWSRCVRRRHAWLTTRRLVLQAQPANGDPALGQPTAYTGEGDAALAFAFDNLLGGTYLLSSNTFTTYGLVSVMSGGRDVKDTGFDAALGRNFDDVTVTLTDKKVEVNGTVRTRAGQPPSAVIAFPADPARWVNYGWSPPRFRTARSGLDGRFNLERLVEGDYFVIAVDASRIDAWTDSRFLAAAAPLATRVSLKWGDTRTVDLPVSEVVVK